LLGIAAVAALLYARNLAEAGLAPFYSVAVKSMSVGLGFQAKMLQAWMIVPALVIGYLLAAPAAPGPCTNAGPADPGSTDSGSCFS
jgi:hypothetical protein